LFAECLLDKKFAKPLPSLKVALVCSFAQISGAGCGKKKMSLQTVFKCPAKLYTLKIFTHNTNRGQVQEHSDRGGVLFFHALKNIMKGVLI
jgi:hypothetical protein